MLKRLTDWFEWASDAGHPRWWWPVRRIFGGPLGQYAGLCYMTRILLTPKTPRGQLYFHIFHHEDLDRDPHDHPFDFWTMPLNQAYYEEVYHHNEDGEDNKYNYCFKVLRVKPWHIHHRPATHTHRVIRTETGRWPLLTLVWRGNHKRKWGFWCHSERKPGSPPPTRHRFWVVWTDYLFKGGFDNHPGNDEACPGYTRNKEKL